MTWYKIEFSETKKRSRLYNLWHIAGIIFLFSFWISMFFFLKWNNPIMWHAQVHFLIFAIIQSIYIIFNLYAKDSSSKFFDSAKAWDIYTHLYGIFSFYLVFIVLFNENITTELYFAIWIILGVSLFGVSFEAFEYITEKTLKIKQRASGTDVDLISESLPNIMQDIISNSVGAFLGFIYVLLFFIL